jgi:tetratricopeptide (TPR) repeat protein
MRLEAVEWAKALRATSDGGPDGPPALVAAEIQSLAALFAETYPDAVSLVARARAADPLNPVHRVRLILVLMRFGDWDAAADLAKSLAESAPGLAIPAYLWGLAVLRREEPKRAANIAADVSTAHPGFGPACFLRAEALMKSQLKGGRKNLADLPRGSQHAALWADLVLKMLLSGSGDVAKVGRELAKDPKVLPPGSRPAELVARAIAMLDEPPERLEARLEDVASGSRTEEVILLVLHDRLRKLDPTETATRLRRLNERFPDRPAVRRLYASSLTRLAVTEAGAERYAAALRLVEACLRLEPYETTHYQNRAALFTQMREPDAYHDSWAELNRHQYRLALLGKWSAADAARLAKPHRLFAQQARLGTQGTGALGNHPGVFAETERIEDGNRVVLFAVNQARLDEDPEVLRQWVHHLRAQMVFDHLALGPDPRRFLLHPENSRAGRARVKGLTAAADSLAVLVPAEGRALADRVVRRWAGVADRLASAYAQPPDDPDVKALKTQYVERFADLAVLCVYWQPDGHRPELVEEALGLLAAVAPFFDEQALATVIKEQTGDIPYPIVYLINYIDKLLGIDPSRRRTLTDQERTRVVNGLAIELLCRQAYRCHAALGHTENAAPSVLAILERTRELDPDNMTGMTTAAALYLRCEYYSEAEAVIARALRSPQAKEERTAKILDELKNSLDERRKVDGKGRRREDEPVGPGAAPAAGERVRTLEEEIERYPSAVGAYEELARELAAAGRFAEARDWSALAVARCSSRDAQLRARSLDLEVCGLEALGVRDQNAVRLYLAGAHRPALDLLDGTEDAESRPYALSYVLGQCFLAVNEPDRAREAFEAALGGCQRSSHRVVLRRLAADVDQAYLLIARRVIQDRIAVGAFEEALAEAGGMMGRLRRPEAALIDLARIHVAAAYARLGSAAEPLARPPGLPAGVWEADFAVAYEAGTDRERARRLAELCRRADPDSAAKAEQLLQRLDTLDEQAVVVETLARSGELLRRGRPADALDALAAVSSDDPRITRQRALILLRLERFDEADAVAAGVRESPSPVAREFLSSYPRLACRQRLTVAGRLIRAGSDTEALRVLDGAAPETDEEKVEIAYGRAFCRAMAGRRLRRQGRLNEARQALADALSEVEAHLTVARAIGHSRLLDLYTTLDADPDLAPSGGTA